MAKIMLIDDDRLFNFLNKRVVEKLNLFNELIIFDNAKKALEEIQTQRFIPNFILLDLMIPLMNGFEFLDEFEKLPIEKTKNIKVIVLTSSLLEEDYNKAILYRNVIAFLAKPLNADKIKPYLT